MDSNLIAAVYIPIGLALLGWLVALVLQRKNIKEQQRVQIRYDIYRQFVSIHKELEDSVSKLGIYASPPFISMDASMIPFELKLNKEYKGAWIPYSEQECVFEGEKKWTEFINQLQKYNSEFSNKYLQMLYITEDWAAPLKPLLRTKDILFKEIERLKKQIKDQLDELQMYSNKHGNDWRKWDREHAEHIAKSINEATMTIGMYIHDFMVLVHNELLSSYFGHKRPTRQTLDPALKVLNKTGFVENVDWDKVKKAESWKTELITYAREQLQRSMPPNGTIAPEYQKFLETIINGHCPDCSTTILILDREKSNENFVYRYACGHSWIGVTLEETIGIKELIKMKLKRPGFGMISRIVQGWKPSGDPRLKDGVDVYMDVNREKNEYHQIVKDNKTQEVLHEEHEPLTDHHPKNN